MDWILESMKKVRIGSRLQNFYICTPLVQTKWVGPSGTQRFCKNDSGLSLESLTVTRVELFCDKRDSSRVTIFIKVTQVESESPKIASWVESLTQVTLSLVFRIVMRLLQPVFFRSLGTWFGSLGFQIGSLRIHTGYLTFLFKKNCFNQSDSTSHVPK